MEKQTKRKITTWLGMLSILNMAIIGIDRSICLDKYKLLNLLKDYRFRLSLIENFLKRKEEEGRDVKLLLTELNELKVEATCVIDTVSSTNRYRVYINYLRNKSDMKKEIDSFIKKFNNLVKKVGN